MMTPEQVLGLSKQAESGVGKGMKEGKQTTLNTGQRCKQLGGLKEIREKNKKTKKEETRMLEDGQGEEEWLH